MKTYRVAFWTEPTRIFGDYEKIVYIKAKTLSDAIAEANSRWSKWAMTGIREVEKADKYDV